MTEVRTPSEDEREQVADVLRVSLNLDAARQEQPIETLSSMFSGFLSPLDTARLGLVESGAAPFLASLFAGPSPWMHDFF